MKAIRLLQGGYWCEYCGCDLEGEPSRKPAVNVVALETRDGYVALEELESNVSVEIVECENGCYEIVATGSSNSITPYSEPWKCGACYEIFDTVAETINCCMG